jgi:uncharacterized Zn finger protein
VDVTEGTIKAHVQGSRPKPYSITIEVKVLADADWKKLVGVLSGQALFVAKLLAGEMPQDIEQVFKDAGLTLFPARRDDLKTECSCPDWSNPCKHIAAVYYLLGEEFDRDPFLIFKMRGLDREKLLNQLSETQPHETKAKQPRAAKAARENEPKSAPEPLASEPGAFWKGKPLPADFFGSVQTPPVAAALPKRLGNFPFWRGTERFLEAIEPVYKQASPMGMDVFLGQRSSPGAGASNDEK